LDPPEEILPEDADAYGQGVQDGRQVGIDGMELGDACVPAREFESEPAGELGSVAWGTWSVGSLLLGPPGIAAKVARGLITILRLGLHTAHTVPPEEVLPGLAQPVLDAMTEYEIGSFELFLGVGRDALATDCEFQLTRLLPSHDAARSAVQLIGRPDWIIVSWRTDQSNSFRVAEVAT
jgi:hypothetical protein